MGRLDGRDALRPMAELAPIGSQEAFADLEVLEGLDDADPEGNVVEELEIPDDVAERIIEWLDHGYPLHQEVTELRPGFEGLAEAHVAVIGGPATKRRWRRPARRSLG